MKIVLFAGAGFSAPFGAPLMNSFFQAADASGRISPDDKDFLRKLRLEARRANSFLESSPTNLEDILTFSEMGERVGLVDRAERRTQRLTGIIQRIYTNVTDVEHYWSRYRRCLERLFGTKPQKLMNDLTLVTTNYDLNLECAVYDAGLRTRLGFTYSRFDSGGRVDGRLYADKGIPLFKLHGSVNWYVDAEDKGIAVEDDVVEVESHLEREAYLPRVCAEGYVAPWGPLIVPPSYLKAHLTPGLHAAWSGAAAALSKATHVLFLGYSFPPTDVEMMYFFARAFSENVDLASITILDPQAREIAVRLRDTRSKAGSHFRDLLNPISDVWQEREDPLEIGGLYPRR